MISYDSDSTDEEYTETGVLLGYPSKEPTEDTFSHLGGQPSWLDGKTAPSAALGKCKVCNDYMSLLLQLNGDLPERFPGHERRLYLFTCRRKACRRKEGSIRGIRATRIAKGHNSSCRIEQKHPEPKTTVPQGQKHPLNLGSQLFRGANPPTSTTANPFSVSTSNPTRPNPFSTSSSAQNLFSTSSLAAKPAQRPEDPQTQSISNLPETFASKVRISSPPTSPPPRPHEPWPSTSAFPPSYPLSHIDADYETLDAPSVPEIPSQTRMDVDGESSAGGKEDKEAFESTLDKSFQRFADRLAQNPEQVLRYEFGGSPLLYSKADVVGRMLAPYHGHDSGGKIKVTAGAQSGMHRCTSCGAERVFEIQLTPGAIVELEVDEIGLEGMDWGTVIMGVCSEDCGAKDVSEGEVGYLEEWVGVQWEEV
ncbi:PDCD2_C domain-containing protein, partial [Patellaria atrata CBS 101060]